MEALVAAGLVGLVLTVLLQFLGVITSHWLLIQGDENNRQLPFFRQKLHLGLFKQCYGESDCEQLNSDVKIDLQDAIIALEILGVVTGGGAVAGIGGFLMLLRRGSVRARPFCYGITLACGAAGGLSITGCILYHHDRLRGRDHVMWAFSADLDYSFYLTCVAGGLFLPVGILLLLGTAKQLGAISHPVLDGSLMSLWLPFSDTTTGTQSNMVLQHDQQQQQQHLQHQQQQQQQQPHPMTLVVPGQPQGSIHFTQASGYENFAYTASNQNQLEMMTSLHPDNTSSHSLHTSPEVQQQLKPPPF